MSKREPFAVFTIGSRSTNLNLRDVALLLTAVQMQDRSCEHKGYRMLLWKMRQVLGLDDTGPVTPTGE